VTRRAMNWTRVGWEQRLRDHGAVSVADEKDRFDKDRGGRWLAKVESRPHPTKLSWAERKRRKKERKRIKRKLKAERRAENMRPPWEDAA